MCKPQRKLHEPLTHEQRLMCLKDTRLDKDIAKELGVHKDTVGRIRRQLQWEQATYGIIQIARTG